MENNKKCCIDIIKEINHLRQRKSEKRTPNLRQMEY